MIKTLNTTILVWQTEHVHETNFAGLKNFLDTKMNIWFWFWNLPPFLKFQFPRSIFIFFKFWKLGHGFLILEFVLNLSTKKKKNRHIMIKLLTPYFCLTNKSDVSKQIFLDQWSSDKSQCSDFQLFVLKKVFFFFF